MTQYVYASALILWAFLLWIWVNAADSESPLCNIAGTVSVFTCMSLRCKVAWDWVSLNIGYLGISLAIPQPGKLG